MRAAARRRGRALLVDGLQVNGAAARRNQHSSADTESVLIAARATKTNPAHRTCIHVSLPWWWCMSPPAPPPPPPCKSSSMAPPLLSGVRGVSGGTGWMSLGTMTRSRPSTKMAPALPEQATAWEQATPRAAEGPDTPLQPSAFLPANVPQPARLTRPCCPSLRRRTCRAAVVGGGEERDEVPLGKALEPVHHALVRAHNHLQPVGLRGEEHGAAAACSTHACVAASPATPQRAAGQSA